MSAIVSFIEDRVRLWGRLRSRGVVLTASLWEGALHLRGQLLVQAVALETAGIEVGELEALCVSLEEDVVPGPCLVDVLAGVRGLRNGLSPGEALLRARVRFQGTDGVRGKVCSEGKGEDPLRLLMEEGMFVPGVVEILCAAFAAVLGGEEKGGRALVAEDGRDAFPGREFSRAAARGFRRGGLDVSDAGILPTPLAAVVAEELRFPFCAVVTASHNPADQNGLKFFWRGRKLLPEPVDFAVSAQAFLYSVEGLPPDPGGVTGRVEPRRIVMRFFERNIFEEEREALRGASIVVDCARGAYSPFAGEILAALGIPHRIVCGEVRGDDINRDSGVSYLEGKERFGGEGVEDPIEVVRVVRETAREGRRGDVVVGLALDGDGDRCFLLLYDVENDAVLVMDGDRTAFLIAAAACRAGMPGRRIFAGTVESDFAVFEAARTLGLETVVTPVGDKWLSADEDLAGRLLVGEEVSGHVVLPQKTPSGRLLYAGNGLLSGLKAAAAILRLGLAPAEAVAPFRKGVLATFYTYFVDKGRFCRGSGVWKKDLETAELTVKEYVASGLLPAGCRMREVEFRGEPDMLYLALEQGGRDMGAVFVRNSGTENKTAAYARGMMDFERALVGLARRLAQNHSLLMRDESLPEARAAEAILSALPVGERMGLEEARRLASEQGVVSEPSFHSLLYAMMKEGRIIRRGPVIEKTADREEDRI